MIDLRRLRPAAYALSGIVSLTWLALSGAIRDFVWADLRKGLLTTKGLDPQTRMLVRLGFALLGSLVAVILLSDLWRSQSQLVVMSTETARGQMAPPLLLPLTLLMLSTAWTFALTGALHTHWLLRLIALGVYLLNAMGWINSILSSGSFVAWETWGALAAILGIALMFAVRWRSDPRPILEFPVLFFLVSGVFLITQHHELRSLNTYGVPIALAKISFNVVYLRGLVSPLFLLIGVDIAEFARRAAHWSTNIVLERTPRFVLGTFLFGLLSWRLYVGVSDLLEYKAESSITEQALAYLGGLVEVVLVAGVFAVVVRIDRQRSIVNERAVAGSASKSIVPLVLAYSAVSLLTFLLLGIAMALPSRQRYADVQSQILRTVDFTLGTVADPWYLLLSTAALIAALQLSRRGNAPMAIYLGTFGVLEIWERLTEPNAFVARLHWHSQAPVEFWWLLAIAAATGVGVTKASLTRSRQGQLLFLLVVITLMRQRGFIENPFSPFFGFVGIGFIAFALVWDLATRGSWANVGTDVLPRTGRIFLYLGYVLLAATVVCWAVATHDLDSIHKLTGGLALLGFDRFGKPLLYAVFMATLLSGRTRLRPS